MTELTTSARIVLEGAALLAVFMAALWVVHLLLANAAIVDVGWAIGLPFLAVWYALRLPVGPNAWLFVAMVGIWGLRLAVYLLRRRVIGQTEEGRYRALRDSWRTHVAAKFFVFFQAQVLLDVALSLPVLIVALNPAPLGTWHVLSALLWAVAVGGETLADRTLDAFKRDPSTRGQVCDRGLWRYSRHPNYFFEWLVWVAYALYASSVPYGRLAWTAPALMLFFLFRVTGIPATEAQALRSRGDAYREYQRTTNAFVPWPRRGAR